MFFFFRLRRWLNGRATPDRRAVLASRSFEPLETRRVLDSVVVFNELMYHPADTDPRGEWIELRNLLSVDVDMSDWAISDGVQFEFPAGTVIPADGYLLVAEQPDALPQLSDTTVLGPWNGRLRNSGEQISLVNNSDRTMDHIEYNDREPWPVGADGGGASLAKRDVYWTSGRAENWELSRHVGGTPGISNQPNFDPAPTVTQVVRLDETWSYDATGVDRGTSWREPGFDDQAWQVGQGPFFAGQEQAGDNSVTVQQLDPSGSGDLDGSATYTHLLDFGTADNGAVIDGSSFTSISATELLTSQQLTWENSSGIRKHGESRSSNLGGPLRELMQDYVSNPLNRADGTAQLTLTGLEVGTRYRTRLFARKSDADPRSVTLEFSHGDQIQSLTLDQNSPDIANPSAPYSIDYEFKATSSEVAITAVQHAGNRPWFWYGLSNEVAQQTGNTEVAIGPQTHYFRTQFSYDGDTLASHEVRLQLHVDDGAVVYLNGTEIHRDNMAMGLVGFETSAVQEVTRTQRRDPVTLPGDTLKLGEPNLLAVEVHQADGNADLRFGARLDVIETPRPATVPPSLLINELPAFDSDQRFVELVNSGDEPVSLDTVTLRWKGADVEREIGLPSTVVAPDSVFSVTVPNNIPFWSDNDHLFLYSADQSVVVDAQVLNDRPIARSWKRGGRWLVPAEPTPGLTNRFEISDSIVINEIMYHAAPQYANADIPFLESSEEWIELFNRSDRPVNLSGWSLAGGIDFVFPANTVLPADSYLIVSSQAEVMKLQWPGVPIVGDFRGSLGNAGDVIILSDLQGNPVDEVSYFDKGTWPSYADGGGSSLELRDPAADNARAEAWAASLEHDKSPWVTVTYEGEARPPRGSQDPREWNELILGLLDAGEVLLDDISVIEDPAGEAIERMQNGSFESQTDHWRFLGTHGKHGKTRVMVDPDDPANHVLRLVASGATEHMHNHVESTFLDNARISSREVYRISLRAKWIAGSPQLHSRLYFNRLAMTHILPHPTKVGTPGQANSQLVDNLAPTFDDLQHEPAVPQPDEPVTVSVNIADPDGVVSARLLFARDGEAFTDIAMSRDKENTFTATIPGFLSGDIVQFYVEASDGRGNTSQYPAEGPESRSLYRVNDGEAESGLRHNIRIIMTDDDLDQLFTRTDFTSNERMGATVIWQESQVYYNVQVRLKGSGFSRGSGATGFNLRFSPDQLLFGEHDVVSIDRQGGPWGIGASHREMTIKHIANRAGNIPMMYDDVIHLMGPRDSLNGSAQFLVARYDDVFLESQYERGGQGTRYKFELIYFSSLTVDGDPEGLKFPPSSSRAGLFPVVGVDMPYMGEDSNSYRWHYLIRNNRNRDDYSRIIALTEALRETSRDVGGDLDLLTQEVMDVDQWMRLFAFESLAGINDTFNQGLPHNLQLYVRPNDQRVIALPWDMDFAMHHSTGMGINGTGSRLTRVINIPTNRRVFQQHLLDIIETAYNEEYLAPWISHLGTRAQQNVSSEILSYVRARRSTVLRGLDDKIPFEITTPNKNNLQVDTTYATLEGNGWIDVREVRLAGQETALPVQWLGQDTWRVVVPIEPGTQTVQLNAYNLRGREVGQATATITTTATGLLSGGLRVSELNYHPANPTVAEQRLGWTDAEAFEFVEVTNVGEAALNLNGVRFIREQLDGSQSGIDFAFSDMELLPDQTVVVAQDLQAFAARYGDTVKPVGEFSGRLSNSGESLLLVGPGNEIIQHFAYRDAWYPPTDGAGSSLEIRSVDTSPFDAWSAPESWRPSRAIGGTPGFTPRPDFNGDSQLNEADVDLLCAALHSNDLRFDLSNDGRSDTDDIVALITDAMGSPVGDVDFDGRFDSSDLVRIFQHAEYEDSVAANSTYVTGDWNCDGDFTTSDLVFAFQRGGYSAVAMPSVETKRFSNDLILQATIAIRSSISDRERESGRI